METKNQPQELIKYFKLLWHGLKESKCLAYAPILKRLHLIMNYYLRCNPCKYFLSPKTVLQLTDIRCRNGMWHIDLQKVSSTKHWQQFHNLNSFNGKRHTAALPLSLSMVITNCGG